MRATLILAAMSLVGCSSPLRMGALDPRPNINLQKSTQSLALKLGDGVPDAYSAQSDTGALEVAGWTGTLTGAFAVAFEKSFTMAHDGDLTLELQEAALSLNAGKALVRYKAQLTDKSGKQPTLISGTADSKTTCSSGSCVPAIATSAVETMYEQIAEKLFSAPR